MNNDPIGYNNTAGLKRGDSVQLKDEYLIQYGRGVLGEGNDQTNMATIVSLDDLRDNSIFINPMTGNNDAVYYLQNNFLIVEFGESFSIYPEHVLELIDDELNESNDPSLEGGRLRRRKSKFSVNRKRKTRKNRKTKRRLRNNRTRK